MFTKCWVWRHWICWLINSHVENRECLPSAVCHSIISREHRWQKYLDIKALVTQRICWQFNYFAGKTRDRCITLSPAAGWTYVLAQTIIPWLLAWIPQKCRDKSPPICVLSSMPCAARQGRWEPVGEMPMSESLLGQPLTNRLASQWEENLSGGEKHHRRNKMKN